MAFSADADDAELVRAAQRGDRDAFSALVTRHAPAMLSLTSRLLGPDDAEDVAQDAFVAAYKALTTFQSGSRFSTWLYRIVVNRCTDVLRARRPANMSLGTDDADPLVAPAITVDVTPLHDLERGRLASELDRSIQALPHLYREAFVLRHIQGLDYDEMSSILSVNRDTLKMRVYKARTQLCRDLAHLAATR
jgi:RNA polymerase sigma-70 factor (ECF subfamily)